MATIRVRARRDDQMMHFKVLIRHPMSARVIDEAGKVLVPPHHIIETLCEIDGTDVFRADIGSGVSKNPFFAWSVPAARFPAAQALTVRWRDNKGASDATTVAIE